MLTQAELEKIHADIVRVRAETMRLVGAGTSLSATESSGTTTEPSKLTAWELFWCPVTIVAGMFVVIGGAMALIILWSDHIRLCNPL